MLDVPVKEISQSDFSRKNLRTSGGYGPGSGVLSLDPVGMENIV